MSNATIKDIARETGLSIATVSRVINNSGYASQEVKEKVLRVAKQLNYQPNAVARSLKIHRTNTIGVIIPDISNSYFMKICRGIEDTIHESGYNLIFVSSDEKVSKEKEMLQVLFEKRVDAIVLATTEENEEMIKKISEAGIPIILIDRKLRNSDIELDLVDEDNTCAAYQLTKHLIEQGHTKIGVINGSIKVSTGLERYEGFKLAIEERGIEENPKYIYYGNFTEEDGIKAVNHFMKLEDKPTAIISFNNMMTFGAILQLIKSGYKIPDDVVIASYGEVEAAQFLRSSGIISVFQSPYEMGVKTGQIILGRLQNNIKSPVHEQFKPQLFTGNKN
ncbi:LacI family DNA-binding transcriptional regulator [Robertmurraya sp. Marseille-Q9965]